MAGTRVRVQYGLSADGEPFAYPSGRVPIDTRVTLRKLEVFDAFVRSGSVRETAAALDVAQPAVSGHLRSLEARVGTPLYRRVGRGLELTDAGRAVHAWATDVLDRTRRVEHELEAHTAGAAGRVVIQASMAVGSYILPPLLAGIRLRRPHVDISLRIVGSDLAVRGVQEGACDFGLILSDAAPAVGGLTARIVSHEPIVVVAGPCRGPTAPLARRDLAGLDVVALPDGYLRRTLDGALRGQIAIARPGVGLELGHPEAIKRAVRDGLGIAVMDLSSVAAEVAEGTLRVLDVEDLRMSVPLLLLVRSDRILTAAQRAVLESIVDATAHRTAPADGMTAAGD